MNIAHLRQCRVGVSGERNDLESVAADGGYEANQFVGFAREGKREKKIARRDHPEVAVHRLHGIQDYRPGSGRGEDRRHLFRDVQILADAGDYYEPAVRESFQHEGDCPGETLTQRITDGDKPFDLDIEDFSRPLYHLLAIHSFSSFSLLFPLTPSLANRLQKRHARGSHDILRGAAAGKIVHRLG